MEDSWQPQTMEMQNPAVCSQTPQAAAVHKGLLREKEQPKQNGPSTQINEKK